MNLLDEFCGASDVTKETLQQNLQDNIDGFTGWESDLSVLRGKVAAGIISQDFYDNLKEMGPKGAGYAKAFVSMTDEELKQYSVKSKGIFDEMNSYVDRSMSAMKNEAAVQLDKLIDLPGEKSNEMKIAYEMLGKYATDGYVEGIRNGSSDVNDAIREMIQSAINTARTVVTTTIQP
jgi:type I site-specific restriction-modification system R (restriction) subunit